MKDTPHPDLPPQGGKEKNLASVKIFNPIS